MKTVLSTQGLCPCSGLTIYGQQVPHHSVNLQGLENGIVMGYCPTHQSRWFIGDRGMCFNIKSTARVVEVLHKKVRGGKHGQPKEEGAGSGRDAAGA